MDILKHGRETISLEDVIGVGTRGQGLTAPASRPRPTKDHRMMTQSMGPTVFLYQSSPNIHPHPGRVYTS